MKEFILRILRAKALINENALKKRKAIVPPNLPPTGNEIVPVVNFQERVITPEIETTHTESLQNVMVSAEQQSIAPRVLLAQPKVKTVPVASYINAQGIRMPQMLQSGQIFGIDKIRNILSDPAVSMIECLGPGKPVMITRMGNVTTSSIILNDDEINEFMKDISQKTRVPIITGLFKAFIANFVVIAVISEFVGTRFVIQRR